MRYSVSDTAEHGDYTGGPRVVTDATREAMRQMLREIQSGHYAEAWIAENRKGLSWFQAARERERHHQIEEVGARLRAMMPFLEPVRVPEPTTA
jgi:ketol-acid reductoisomerase